MNLCQLSTVKLRLGLPEADVRDDELLANAIAAVSGRFELECNRQFARSAAATFEFRGDELLIAVDRYPIESVTSWHLKDDETTGWVLQSDIVYLLNPTKSLLELSIPLGTSRQVAKVTYAGGYVLPGDTASAGQTELPDALEQAAVEQVVYWYQNKDRLGLSSISGSGGSLVKDPVSVVAPLSLLPSVMAVLKKYERWRN